jgi:hypothetical protein
MVWNAEFQDVNMDGYIDIVVNTGGIRNETHDLYIWDASSKNFIKVIYEGFEILARFEVNEGYIVNSVMGYSPEVSIEENLIWNGHILTKDINPDTSSTMELDSSIIPSVTLKPDIYDIDLYYVGEVNERRDTYTIHHKKDNSTYVVIVIGDEKHHYTIQIFDRKSNMLQTLELGSGHGIEFQDVNMDGYIDIVVNTGGTKNETHDLYTWDASSKNFIKVVYEGIEMLAWFSVRVGYIENFIRGDSPEESIKEKLIWNGNILTKDINPYTSATMELDSSIIPSVTSDPDIYDIEPYYIKEITVNEKRNTYTIHHKKDKSTYVVIATRDEEEHYNIQLFDEKSNIQQTLKLGKLREMIEFRDVNLDGCLDIVTRIFQEHDTDVGYIHDLYVWDTSSKNFIRVIYEGFDMLAWFTVHEGYIENFIRGSSPDDSVMQKLIWNGNTLTKES